MGQRESKAQEGRDYWSDVRKRAHSESRRGRKQSNQSGRKVGANQDDASISRGPCGKNNDEMRIPNLSLYLPYLVTHASVRTNANHVVNI